jgi:hypothetical protein
MIARSWTGRVAIAGALVLPLAVVVTATPATAADVASISCAAAPPGTATSPTPLASFTPTAPRRLVDTRDGTGGVAGLVGAGCTLRLDMAATGASPDAEAFALSLTGISATGGYLTVYPCAAGLPPTSNLNTRPGTPTPNLAVARPDADGHICIFSDAETQLLVDLTGWWTSSGDTRFASIDPERVEDTRSRPGQPRVPAGTAHVVELGDEVPAGTTAVVANLTIAAPADNGFATAFPCGGAAPGTSNVNFRAGEARASAIIVGLDSARRLCVQSSVDAHVIVDLAGYYEEGQFGPTISLQALAGDRLADSRDGTGGWNGPFAPGSVRRVNAVAGRPDAAQATAAIINVVALRATEPGFVQIYPCDGSSPETSVVNYTAAGATSNLATVELATSGELCVTASTQVDVIIDLFGVLTAPTDALVERLTFGTETWPPYTTDGSDYAVRCDASATLDLDLLGGTTARVNGVPVATGTIALGGADHTLTSVRLSRSGTTTTHWFRCVPDDFPRIDVERSGSTTPGWYLTMLYEPGAAHSYATIMDGRGAPVWYQATDPGSIEYRLRDDGLFVGVAALGPRYGVLPDAGYEVFTLTGDVVKTIVTVDEGGVEHPTDHHDLVDLPGGASAVITYPLEDGQDLTAIGFGADETIAENVIQELDAAGNLRWSWRARDHFVYEEATFAQRFPPVPSYAGDEVDVWHLNSLDGVDGGDYVASARHLDAVFRIDRGTGDVEWVLGPPLTDDMVAGLDPVTVQALRDRRLEIVGDPLGGPRRPHDARLNGNVLTLLDNRTATGQPARAVTYRIDTTAGTATLISSIVTSSGSSSFGLGAYRVAADGSSLVTWGNGPVPLFEEFDANRTSVLRFFQEGGYSYRITKEPLSKFSAAVLRATAGGTIG